MAELDTTVAGAAANSYLTVEDADALAAADMGPDAEKWLAASSTDDKREIALKRATREIDDYYRPGAKHTTTQRLRFPITGHLDANEDPEIRPEVQHGTYYQAIFVLARSGEVDRSNARQARNVSQSSEANIQYTTANDPSSLISLRTQQAMAGYATADRDGGGMTVVHGDTGLTDRSWDWDGVIA